MTAQAELAKTQALHAKVADGANSSSFAEATQVVLR
jgi:hypothetical protein